MLETPQTHSSDLPAREKPRGKPRAVLIVNPYSSGMTAKREKAIVLTLREHLDLAICRTERSGHATQLAKEALDENVDYIVACGGDGTGNEVINGLKVDTGTANTLPDFVLIPAGGTNVLARSLGLPNDPVKATTQLAVAIANRHSHTINLGMIDERRFLFSAGVGLDGAVVRRIEEKRSGRRPSDLSHAATLVGLFTKERGMLRDSMTVTVHDTGEELRCALLMCANSRPLSYVGKLALDPMPNASLHHGLDFIAPRKISAAGFMTLSTRALGVRRKGITSVEKIQPHSDVASFSIECDNPQPCQVDGEYIGDRTHIKFRSLERSINMVY